MQQYEGTVVRRSGQAGALGFPTINLVVETPPAPGIYAGTVHCGAAQYRAAVYSATGSTVLEAHLLDFSGDLSDLPVTIVLDAFIREDQRFDSQEELKQAIRDDIVQVRSYFNLS